MALRLIQIDDVTGAIKRGPIGTPAAHVDEDFATIAVESTFSVVENFTATQKIDVWVDGSLKREGATEDYQRNDSLNRIVFNSDRQIGSWVRVRVHPE